MNSLLCLFFILHTYGLVYGNFNNEQESNNKKVEPDTHIVGGINVAITDFPYQLSLMYKNYHMCGASIIHTDWALTAAHCVHGSYASYMKVRAGSSSRTTGGSVHYVSKKIMHPLYDTTTTDYDIALLKVGTPFVYKSTVSSIALPTLDYFVPENTNVTLSGWGALIEGGSSPPIILQAVSLSIVSAAKCADTYPGLTSRMICAGFAPGGKDTCQGDSGGPMVAVINGVKLQIGIVSFGNGCARPEIPGVYSNVANLRNWIKSETGNAV